MFVVGPGLMLATGVLPALRGAGELCFAIIGDGAAAFVEAGAWDLTGALDRAARVGGAGFEWVAFADLGAAFADGAGLDFFLAGDFMSSGLD